MSRIFVIGNSHLRSLNNNLITRFFIGPGFDRKLKFYLCINDLVPIICKAGTMIIFDTNTIHCGGDNFKENKYRQVMRLYLRKKV